MPDVKLPHETWRTRKACPFVVPSGIWRQNGACQKAAGHKGRHRGHTWVWEGPRDLRFDRFPWGGEGQTNG